MPDLNSPILTGDVSGGLHTTSVDKLKGQPVSATAPTSGQTLVWNGSAWAPATPSTGGGGGANGLTYYLRQDIDADAPTTNLPGTPKQLGRTGATGQTSVTSGILTTGVWTLLGGYVSESVPIDPNITAIPGGLWDFNVWALGTANANAGTVIRAKVYTYDGTNAPTLLGTSGEQVINNVSAQFSLSVLVPQTTVQLTTRIYVEIEVKAAANNHTATLEFGDGTPSHVHTSLPLVGGTGLWKNVSGVLQSPASLLVDADVDAAAAIAQSKIANLTTDLGNKADKTTTISAGTGLTGGGDLSANRTLAVSYGTTAGTAAQGNDSRLSDSRTPTGSASGDLTGTYPAPTLAAITTAQSNVGSSTQIPVLSIDAKGRVTALSSTAAAGGGGTPAQVDVYSTAGTFTWTKPAGATSVQITVIGGGGGGGSGRRATAASGLFGGGGGAGGGYTQRTIAANLLGATETVTVGGGGNGGGSQTNNDTNGVTGATGTTSSFGTWVFAAGGAPGGGGNTLNGSGGSTVSQRAMFVGGAGGNSNITVTAAGGTSSQTGGPGGGAGGGITTAGAFLSGGGSGIALASFLAASGTAAGTTDGASGAAGSSVTANWPLAGMGGGGGASSAAGAAGSGGAGGLYGAGGGGGGASTNGNNSGAGGAGARGIVVVITYF